MKSRTPLLLCSLALSSAPAPLLGQEPDIPPSRLTILREHFSGSGEYFKIRSPGSAASATLEWGAFDLGVPDFTVSLPFERAGDATAIDPKNLYLVSGWQGDGTGVLAVVRLERSPTRRVVVEASQVYPTLLPVSAAVTSDDWIVLLDGLTGQYFVAAWAGGVSLPNPSAFSQAKNAAGVTLLESDPRSRRLTPGLVSATEVRRDGPGSGYVLLQRNQAGHWDRFHRNFSGERYRCAGDPLSVSTNVPFDIRGPAGPVVLRNVTTGAIAWSGVIPSNDTAVTVSPQSPLSDMFSYRLEDGVGGAAPSSALLEPTFRAGSPTEVPGLACGRVIVDRESFVIGSPAIGAGVTFSTVPARDPGVNIPAALWLALPHADGSPPIRTEGGVSYLDNPSSGAFEFVAGPMQRSHLVGYPHVPVADSPSLVGLLVFVQYVAADPAGAGVVVSDIAAVTVRSASSPLQVSGRSATTSSSWEGLTESERADVLAAGHEWLRSRGNLSRSQRELYRALRAQLTRD